MCKSPLHYVSRLGSLTPASLEYRRIISDLVKCYSIVVLFMVLLIYPLIIFFQKATHYCSTRDHSMKLRSIELVHCVFRHGYISECVISIWNSLSDDCVTSLNLIRLFKSHLLSTDLTVFCKLYQFRI